jgi:hypothetical protein
MHRSVGLFLSAMVTLSASSYGQGSAQDKLFSIRSGENIPLRNISWVTTATCASLLVSVEGIDVLEGPPGLSLRFEPGKVRGTLEACTGKNDVDGGTIIATATEITEKTEAVLTYRVRLITKSGPTQLTYRNQVLLFPSNNSKRE